MEVNMRFLFLPYVIIFVLWLNYEIKKSHKKTKNRNERFWALEHKANGVRKQDISTLDYINIPMNQLPFQIKDDKQLLECQETILSLKEEKILNLQDKTNTDLKLLYGVGNLNFLTQCDSNFATLLRTIYLWGNRLAELDYTKEAIALLEYGVTLQTDLKKHYDLLGSLYVKTNQLGKIPPLIEKADKLTSIMKPSIVASLQKLLS